MSATECERLRPYLLDYVVGELDPAEAERLKLESHLAACIECRAAVEELRGTGRALEAVKAFDSQLTEGVRQDISRRARLEAEKLRAAHAQGRTLPARSVPVSAWLILVLGTAVVLAGVALIPRLGALGHTPGARLLGASGAQFPAEFAPGETIKVPAGAMLKLELAGRAVLALRGPAEAELASGQAPLKIVRGQAFLAAGGAPVAVSLAPLRQLELGAEEIGRAHV
jgi:anti-sigma factor RsiW